MSRHRLNIERIPENAVEQFPWPKDKRGWTFDRKREYLYDRMAEEEARDAAERVQRGGFTKRQEEMLTQTDICPVCDSTMRKDPNTELFICLRCAREQAGDHSGDAPHEGITAW